MTSVFSDQSRASFSWSSSQDDVATSNRDETVSMRFSSDIISSSTQSVPRSNGNDNENYFNRFYLELMGDQLGPSLNKYSLHENGGEPCSLKASRQEDDNDQGTILLDGEELESNNKPESFNNFQNTVLFTVPQNPNEELDLFIIKGTDCSVSSTIGVQNEFPENTPSTSKLTREQNSLCTLATSDTGHEQVGRASASLVSIQIKDDGDCGDRARSSHTLSIILEEEEDSYQDASHNSEQPWSHLLATSPSQSAYNIQHKQHSQTLKENKNHSNQQKTADPAKIDVLTLVKNCNVMDGTDGGLMLPLFDGQTKMSRSQTLQVAALMAVGIILVTGILVWVFSPVILGIW